MLPPKVLSLLGKMINFGYKFGFIPYKWNEKKKKFSFNSSILLWYRFLLQFFVLLIYEAFLIFRCFQTWGNENETLMRKIRVLYLAFVFVSLNISHIVTFKHYGRHHLLIQNFVDITKRFKSEYGPFVAYKSGADIIRFLKLLSFACSFASITIAIGVFKDPKSPRLLTSLFENPKGVPVVLKILIGLFHFYLGSFHYYAIGIYYAITQCYVYAALPMIERLTYVEDDRRLQSLITHSIICKYHHVLAVLQRNFNNIFGIWTLGIQIFTLTVIILNFFQAVVFDHPRSLIMGLNVFVLTCYMYKKFSIIHEVSFKTIETWKLKRNPLWFRKFVKACEPLKVTIGEFYYADRALVLTMVSIIFTNSVNLIVTYKVDHTDAHE